MYQLVSCGGRYVEETYKSSKILYTAKSLWWVSWMTYSCEFPYWLYSTTYWTQYNTLMKNRMECCSSSCYYSSRGIFIALIHASISMSKFYTYPGRAWLHRRTRHLSWILWAYPPTRMARIRRFCLKILRNWSPYWSKSPSISFTNFLVYGWVRTYSSRRYNTSIWCWHSILLWRTGSCAQGRSSFT